MKESEGMKFNDYILLYLKDNPEKLPSIHFWASTLMMCNAGVKIQMSNGHFLTVHDCFVEMEDYWRNEPIHPRLYWYIFQRKKYFNEFKSSNIDVNTYKNF